MSPDPPPTSDAAEAVWCGFSKGGREESVPPTGSPDSDRIELTSSAASGSREGSRPGSRDASIAGGLGLWLAVAAAGVVVGGALFGLYLALMSGVFGQLPNNAFGSLAIEDYKGFLRMRLTPAGLEVLMLGTDRVAPATAWRVVDRFVIGKTARP